MRFSLFLSYCFGVLALSACSSYVSHPINFQDNTAQWLAISNQLCPDNSSISRQSSHELTLLLNSDLRASRLQYAKSTAIEGFAGLWDDPSLSLGAVRVLDENITNFGVSPGFTLPVTGLPSLSKKIAAHYKEADFWKMRAQERACLSSLDLLLTRNLVCHAKLKLQNNRLFVAQEECAMMQSLYDLGELSFAELQFSKQRVFDLKEQGRILERAHLDLHLELTTLMGLHPDVGALVEVQGALPSHVPSALPSVDAVVLLDSPSLLSIAASYEASEVELRRELRKQYPELGLSPAVEREEGNMKLGLGFSFSVPAWNRNREQIAASTAQREIVAHDLITEYRRLLNQSQALSQQEELALAHCYSESQRIVELQQILDTQESLYKLGEIDFALLADARHQLYQTRLAYLDCMSDLLLIQVKLYSLNPHNTL